MLVFFEKIDGMVKAIEREKELKAGNRVKKVTMTNIARVLAESFRTKN